MFGAFSPGYDRPFGAGDKGLFVGCSAARGFGRSEDFTRSPLSCPGVIDRQAV